MNYAILLILLLESTLIYEVLQFVNELISLTAVRLRSTITYAEFL